MDQPSQLVMSVPNP